MRTRGGGGRIDEACFLATQASSCIFSLAHSPRHPPVAKPPLQNKTTNLNANRIDDPDAKKPADWDNRRTLPDMDAAPPAGWLEHEPTHVFDEAAVRPDDWDDAADGAWAPPQVCVCGGGAWGGGGGTKGGGGCTQNIQEGLTLTRASPLLLALTLPALTHPLGAPAP